MADIYLAVDGQRATAIDAFVPLYGAPVADVTLSASNPLPDTSVIVKIGNLSMRMTVVRQRAFAGSTQARLVGGFGGWQKVVTLAPYSNTAGVLMGSVLRDAATYAGEQVNVAPALNVSLGTRWVPEPGIPAGRILAQLAGSLWWIDTAGVTQVASERTAPAILSSTSVEFFDGGRGLLNLATEDPAAWMPGATYTGPTVPEGVTVRASRIIAHTDGRLRVEALTA